MMRKFIVAANWKMNGNIQVISGLAKTLGGCVPDPSCNDIVLCVPSAFIQQARQCFPPAIGIGAQNCYKVPKGAFTGEISPAMIKDVGGSWALLGQAERRRLFGESNDLVGEKIGHALNEGLQVIACVGETCEEREAKKTDEIIIKQACSIVKNVKEWCKLVIAYEPLWAIGTGKCATPDDVQKVHCMIRSFIAEKVSSCVADGLRIAYAGEANAENCKKYIEKPDIDGFLIGETSMGADFQKIMVCRQG